MTLVQFVVIVCKGLVPYSGGDDEGNIWFNGGAIGYSFRIGGQGNRSRVTINGAALFFAPSDYYLFSEGVRRRMPQTEIEPDEFETVGTYDPQYANPQQ